MMLEPAQCAGDAPLTAREQGISPESSRTLNAPPTPTTPTHDHTTRLPTPARDARLRAEREQWLRRRRLERQLHDGAALRISALSLQLGLFRHRVPEAEPDLHASIEGLQDELHAVLTIDVVGVELRHADGMLDVVRRLGGTIDVAGGPDAGTITARIPCE